jgi:hypothetical protein
MSQFEFLWSTIPGIPSSTKEPWRPIHSPFSGEWVGKHQPHPGPLVKEKAPLLHRITHLWRTIIPESSFTLASAKSEFTPTYHLKAES